MFYSHTMCVPSHLAMSNSLWPFGLQPTRLLCPCNFSGKNTGMGCHFLLQGIFPTQESNEPTSLSSLAFAGGRFTTELPGKPFIPHQILSSTFKQCSSCFQPSCEGTISWDHCLTPHKRGVCRPLLLPPLGQNLCAQGILQSQDIYQWYMCCGDFQKPNVNLIKANLYTYTHSPVYFKLSLDYL